MIIDGIAASEAIDSSGEILDIKGCDISDLEQGLGVLNWEHRGDDAHGASANDIIGKIVYAKKIFSAEDCSDDRQLDYYQKIKLPCIYVICRLFDGSNHPGAVAAAAIIRDYQSNNEPLLIRYSIEGTTLSKDKGTNRLTESIARRVAATIKPCNKSCHSGLISDPNGPETKKSEAVLPHPNFTPLGGSFEYSAGTLEAEDMQKTLTAGSYNVAPGTLTGGSALQVEDRGLRNRVKAAVRDWDRVTPFKKFLKHRLPEASDDFLDRFNDLVQDYTIKKAQREVVRDALIKKVADKVKPSKPEEPLGGSLTIRGKPVKDNAPETKISFDERKGVLHTPRGSFPMYIPSKDKENPDAGQSFANIMNDPKIGKFHDYAMENWSKVHQHLKAGTLPPEVVMHGVLFSQLSPNTPVPMQELMYGHLVDAMKHKGTDFRSPNGHEALKQDWLDRDQPQRWPEHSREHFKRLEGQLRMKNDSKSGTRKAGDIGSFMLANNKFKSMEQYHTLHDSLMDLVSRHRHDARSGVEELMFHKKQAGLWDAKRRRWNDKGQGDIGDYKAGPSVPGLAPKTARYTYGMLGGGNVVVPDTHFVRYLFGLDRQKDGATIDHIKSQLWNEQHSHVLNGIDRYYGKHHDAVKHMQQHPVWGKHFEKPEDAIFPAFWKNWVGILPHEAARGMKTNGWNESTDHKPFWDAVGPYMRKNEGLDTNLAHRTAKAHAEWVEKYGEMPAQLMYFHYLVPQLLAAGEKRAQIQKFETISSLMKDEKTQVFEQPPPETVKFNDKVVKPGQALVQSAGEKKPSNFFILDQDATHYIGVPHDKVFGWESKDLLRFPKSEKGKSVHVLKAPEHLDEPSITSAASHGVPEYSQHPAAQALMEGLDFNHPENKGGDSGYNRGVSFWSKLPNGQRVYVKGNGTLNSDRGHPGANDMTDARREALYHDLAHDFYGLGDFVPPTALVRHPQTGEEHAIVQHVPADHFDYDAPEHHDVLAGLHDRGDLQKLAVMNMINGNWDRHDGNFMFGHDGKLKLIDHGYAFSRTGHHDMPGMPDYMTFYGKNHDVEPIHPLAQKWVKSLSPSKLGMHMRRRGVPEKYINEAVRRLHAVQQHARKLNRTEMFRDMYEAPFSL